MKKLLKLLCIISVMGIFLVSTLPTASTEAPFKINVLDVSYTDLDVDGLEDDIFIHFNFNWNSRMNGVTKLQLLVTIGLPSGNEFISAYEIKTNIEDLNLGIDALNTATEPGWYTLKMEGIIIGNAGAPAYNHCTKIFDPPGGHSGDPKYSIYRL